jgi:hypothetical protein
MSFIFPFFPSTFAQHPDVVSICPVGGWVHRLARACLKSEHYPVSGSLKMIESYEKIYRVIFGMHG